MLNSCTVLPNPRRPHVQSSDVASTSSMPFEFCVYRDKQYAALVRMFSAPVCVI